MAAAKKRAAIYARVSTGEQNTDGQLHQLREFCARQEWEAVEFVDHGVSGAKAKRPALEALREAIHRRRVDVVAVTKLDRLARSVGHLVLLAEELRAAGVDLIVLDQHIDTSTSAGRFVFHTLAAVAELERDLIRERTRAGLEAARRHGKRLGRPRRLDAEGVKRLARMHGRGKSHRHIAKVLGIGEGTVRRELARLNGAGR